MSDVIHELEVDVPADVVYRCFTVAEDISVWMDVGDVVADARPGGELRWTHANDRTVEGAFVELDPPRRVVFSYGWEDGWHGVPAGSSEVEVLLTPVGDGSSTRVRLTHRGLTFAAAEAHRSGWAHFLERLSSRYPEAQR